MMMDAPGTCSPPCAPDSGGRDQWGNCIDAGCTTWFDGCNTCTRDEPSPAQLAASRNPVSVGGMGMRGGMSCTEMWCDQRGTAECRDGQGTASGGAGDRCHDCKSR